MQSSTASCDVILKSAVRWSTRQHLQPRGLSVPVSLRPVLRTVASYAMVTGGRHVVSFFHLVGV